MGMEEPVPNSTWQQLLRLKSLATIAEAQVFCCSIESEPALCLGIAVRDAVRDRLIATRGGAEEGPNTSPADLDETSCLWLS